MYERYERIVKSLRYCMRLEEPAFKCIEMDGGCCDSIGRCIPHLMDEAADAIEELSKRIDQAAEGEMRMKKVKIVMDEYGLLYAILPDGSKRAIKADIFGNPYYGIVRVAEEPKEESEP